MFEVPSRTKIPACWGLGSVSVNSQPWKIPNRNLKKNLNQAQTLNKRHSVYIGVYRCIGVGTVYRCDKRSSTQTWRPLGFIPSCFPVLVPQNSQFTFPSIVNNSWCFLAGYWPSCELHHRASLQKKNGCHPAPISKIIQKYHAQPCPHQNSPPWPALIPSWKNPTLQPSSPPALQPSSPPALPSHTQRRRRNGSFAGWGSTGIPFSNHMAR